MMNASRRRRVGVAVVGLGGAVATTAVAGVELLRHGGNSMNGLPLADVAVPGLAGYEDLVFGGWDVNGQSLAAAAAEHHVLNDNQRIDMDKYLEYGPPYYAIANIFVTGANFIYYTFSIVYVFTKYWRQIKKAFVGMVVNTWKRRSIYSGFSDGQTRLMQQYKEVPEWWYGIIFVFGFAVSIISLTAWPTQTPWWSILGVTAIGAVHRFNKK